MIAPRWTRWTRNLVTREGQVLGAAPGTLVQKEAAPIRLDAIAYQPDELKVFAEVSLEELGRLHDDDGVVWLNGIGVDDGPGLAAIGKVFGVHPLVLEDIQHANQRPKAEEHGELVFVVLPMPDEEGRLEQVTFVMGPRFVLSFQERPGDCFAQVRKRLRKPGSRLRTHGPDYLLYALLDAVVDHYAPVLDRFYASIDELEDRALASRSGPEVLRQILELRKRLVAYRRVAHPIEEAIRVLVKDDGELPHLTDFVRPYLRDTADHAARVADIVDAQRDLAGGLLELFRGQAAQEANESMRVLTIIATVFIPLSFIAGVYGMNFDQASPYNMPELGWRLGYPFALVIMVLAAGGLLAWMWKKGWLGAPPTLDTSEEDSQ